MVSCILSSVFLITHEVLPILAYHHLIRYSQFQDVQRSSRAAVMITRWLGSLHELLQLVELPKVAVTPTIYYSLLLSHVVLESRPVRKPELSPTLVYFGVLWYVSALYGGLMAV